MVVVYISQRCPNCVRLLESLRQIPSLQSARVVDIDVSPVSGIDYVPTVVDGGSTMTGAKAFEWLQQYQGEVDLQPVELGFGGLSYGLINDSNSVGYASGAFPFSEK
jgi:hypothetical protein